MRVLLATAVASLVGVAAVVVARSGPPRCIWTDDVRFSQTPGGPPLAGWFVWNAGHYGPSRPRTLIVMASSSWWQELAQKTSIVPRPPWWETDLFYEPTTDRAGDVRDATGRVWWRCDLAE